MMCEEQGIVYVAAENEPPAFDAWKLLEPMDEEGAAAGGGM